MTCRLPFSSTEMLKAYLDTSGERAPFLGLDIEWDRPHFESQATLLRKIELELGQRQGYVFITVEKIPCSLLQGIFNHPFRLR
jgi:hypothetical protein